MLISDNFVRTGMFLENLGAGHHSANSEHVG